VSCQTVLILFKFVHAVGWHIKELQLNKLWSTEHTANYTMDVHPDYATQTANANIVAKQPAVEPVSDNIFLCTLVCVHV